MTKILKATVTYISVQSNKILYKQGFIDPFINNMYACLIALIVEVFKDKCNNNTIKDIPINENKEANNFNSRKTIKSRVKIFICRTF